ncbi:MAG: hypothetical protein C0404_10980 [Verrucomicrobia bacterium]|nr:hypothetical protein [Verrucomicrobiota bacterium]
MTMVKQLKVLIVEDSEDDASLLVRELRKGGFDVSFARVDLADDMRKALNDRQWDLVLSDHSMPAFNSFEAISVLKQSGLDIPFILVSGSIGEELAVAVMKVGASDFIFKDRLSRLVPAIERELKDAQVRQQRKLAEESLERNRAELKAIYDHTPVMMCTLDAERRVRYVNRAFTEFTGIPEKELLAGRACGVFGCINALDDARGCGFGPKCPDCRLREAVEETLKTGREHRDIEYRATLERNGTRRDVVLIGSTVRTSGPGDPQILLCLHDLTERIRMEDDLRFQGRILSNLSEGINLVRASDFSIIHTNPRFDAMFGYVHGELIGKHVSVLNAPNSGSPYDVADKIAVSLREEGSWHGEVRNITKSGEEFWCHASVTTMESSQYGKAYLSIHTNITERKRTEDALRASEVRYRRLFESAKDGILILDAETGMIQDVNPFLIEMLGYSHETFLGKKVWELGSLKDLFANQINFTELQKNEYIRYEDMALETSDGKRVEVEFVSNVYLVNNRKVIQCNIRNITERKMAEERIRIQLDELKRWQNVTVGREGRVQELKREVNELAVKAGEKKRYEEL